MSREPVRESFFRRLDGRLKLPLLLAACFVCQFLPAHFLPLWLLAVAVAFRAPETRTRERRLMLGSAVYFILFWLCMTLASNAIGGVSWAAGLMAALTLGGRMLALTGVGILFSAWSSPVETGRAAAWFLYPLTGEKSWKFAVAIALTAWFFPLILRQVPEIREGMRTRGLRLPWRRAFPLMVMRVLHSMEQKAAEVAVALASRRLDDPARWRPGRN